MSPYHLDASQQEKAAVWEIENLRPESYTDVTRAILSVSVVTPKAIEYQAILDGAFGYNEESLVALQAVEAIMPPRVIPQDLFPKTIVPLEVRAPTARLISDEFGTGSGMPWTTSPASLVLVAPVIGTMLIYVGRQVAAQIAIAGVDELLLQAKKKYNMKNVRIRFQTGLSETKKGSVVRPRGSDGKIPEGTDPYEDPDDTSWFKPWTWF